MRVPMSIFHTMSDLKLRLQNHFLIEGTALLAQLVAAHVRYSPGPFGSIFTWEVPWKYRQVTDFDWMLVICKLIPHLWTWTEQSSPPLMCGQALVLLRDCLQTCSSYMDVKINDSVIPGPEYLPSSSDLAPNPLTSWGTTLYKTIHEISWKEINHPSLEHRTSIRLNSNAH